MDNFPLALVLILIVLGFLIGLLYERATTKALPKHLFDALLAEAQEIQGYNQTLIQECKDFYKLYITCYNEYVRIAHENRVKPVLWHGDSAWFLPDSVSECTIDTKNCEFTDGPVAFSVKFNPKATKTDD